MAEIIIVGPGTIVGRWGDLWEIDNGMSKVYVAQENMLLKDPGIGRAGVLTYEHRAFSRVGCFRAADDAAVRAGGCL